VKPDRTRLAEPVTVLVTGASGGIGGALAKAYASPNRRLILQGRKLPELEQLARHCRERGAEVRIELRELRDTKAWMAWLAGLAEQQPIDLAIINAGVTSHIGADGRGEDWSQVDAVIDVNIRAAIATAEALLPAMRRRGHGQIALISSVAAYIGLPLTPSYCASKAALKVYGEALRGWLANDGIAVNVVLPGFVESAMSRQFPGPKMFVLAPERAAFLIRRGLARDRARIGFPFLLNWALWALGVLPPALSLRILRGLGYGGGEQHWI
jgi:short-subunit dehydrogenase